MLATLLTATAEAMIDVGRVDEAEVLVDEAFELARNADLGVALAIVLIMFGATQIERERPAAAIGVLHEHLRFVRDRYLNPLSAGDCLAQLAAAHALIGEDDVAARLWGASEAIQRDHGIDPDRRRPHANQRRLDAARHRFGPERFDATALGGSIDPERVISQVLAGDHGVTV